MKHPQTLSPVFTLALVATLAPAALAQPSSIDVTSKWSWGENVGFMNWRDAGSPEASQGVFADTQVLGGFIWCENAGWVSVGDGSPANGVAYANVNGTDFGVNINPATGALSGLAWGENIGWINFGPHASLPAAQQARYDGAALRLRGYAWGENVGWINLDDDTHFVGTSCPVDFNCDGFLDFFDYDDFVATFEGGQPPACRSSADYNGDGFVDFFDYDDFVASFEAGC
jgi:hypothetical protein